MPRLHRGVAHRLERAGRPARPSVTGAYGGRHVVVPVSAMVLPVAWVTIATVLTSSSLPWVGPMVAVVIALGQLDRGEALATAPIRSRDDTSSQKSTMP